MKRMEFRLIILLVLSAIILFASTACDKNKKLTPPPQMIGTWIGMGMTMISNEILNQRQITVMLIIDEDGSITGYIGDALIQNASLQSAQWWQKLRGKQKYTSAFRLDGFIVKGENFKRDGGTVIFEKIGENEITCSFTSDGSQENNSNIALTVEEIVLHHQ